MCLLLIVLIFVRVFVYKYTSQYECLHSTQRLFVHVWFLSLKHPSKFLDRSMCSTQASWPCWSKFCHHIGFQFGASQLLECGSGHLNASLFHASFILFWRLLNRVSPGALSSLSDGHICSLCLNKKDVKRTGSVYTPCKQRVKTEIKNISLVNLPIFDGPIEGGE